MLSSFILESNLKTLFSLRQFVILPCQTDDTDDVNSGDATDSTETTDSGETASDEEVATSGEFEMHCH